jgi:glycosyltransferase involved in cell wall biosynthesis
MYEELVRKRKRYIILERWLGRSREIIKYAFVRPKENRKFLIVSSQRNAGKWAIKCLDSVYHQRYDKRLVRHVFIDDASTDETPALIQKWLQEHPDNSVIYIQNETRKYGFANLLTGFRMALPGEIVMELDGDDWFPDKSVLKFYNKVYSDENVWITYNSWKTPKVNVNVMYEQFKVPRKIIETNSIRDCPRWLTSSLHTFRAELFFHVNEEDLIDPQTGEYWKFAWDLAVYFPCWNWLVSMPCI